MPIWIIDGPMLRGSGTPPVRLSRMSPVTPIVWFIQPAGKAAAPKVAGTMPTSVMLVLIVAVAVAPAAVVSSGLGVIVIVGTWAYPLPAVTTLIAVTTPPETTAVAVATGGRGIQRWEQW